MNIAFALTFGGNGNNTIALQAELPLKIIIPRPEQGIF
jgi:hypothetical protein